MIRGLSLDPVAVKELQGLSRRWPTHLARLVYVALLGLILYSFQSRFDVGEQVLSVSHYAELGRDLFQFFFWPNLALVTLAAISSAADLVTREVRAGTLGLLGLTTLTPFRIAAGKWKSAMAQTGTLVLCGAPVGAVCFYLGGIGLWEVAWSLAVTLATAALAAALGIRASAMYATPGRAFMVATGLLIAYAILPAFVLIPVWPAVFLGPFVHILYAAVAAYGDHGGPEWPSFGWITAAPVTLWVVFRVLRSAGRHLEWHLKETARPATSTDMNAGNPYSGVRLPGRGLRSLRGEVWEDRPLLWKELATRAAARLSPGTKDLTFVYGLLLVLICGALSLERVSALFWGLAALFLVLAALHGASLFTHEKEGRRLEMLLSAPLSSWEIVRAKLVAGLISTEAQRALFLWVLTLAVTTWWMGLRAMGVVAAVSTLFLLFAYVLGAAASLRARSIHAAFFFAVAALLALLVGAPYVASHLGDGGFAERLVATTHPVYIIAPAIEAAGDAHSAAAEVVLPRFAGFVSIYLPVLGLLVADLVTGLRRVAERS